MTAFMYTGPEGYPKVTAWEQFAVLFYPSCTAWLTIEVLKRHAIVFYATLEPFPIAKLSMPLHRQL